MRRRCANEISTWRKFPWIQAQSLCGKRKWKKERNVIEGGGNGRQPVIYWFSYANVYVSLQHRFVNKYPYKRGKHIAHSFTCSPIHSFAINVQRRFFRWFFVLLSPIVLRLVFMPILCVVFVGQPNVNYEWRLKPAPTTANSIRTLNRRYIFFFFNQSSSVLYSVSRRDAHQKYKYI